jgi:hypothetical protein
MSATKMVYSELRNFVNSQINRIERFDKDNNETLTIFFVQGRDKTDDDKIDLIAKELRTSDLVFKNGHNFVFVLQQTDGSGAVHVKRMLEEFFEEVEIPTAYVSFPEDGKTTEKLLKLIKNDIADYFNIELHL